MAKEFHDCEESMAALEDGSTCHQFRGVRSAVMCRAWSDFRGGRAPTFSAAVDDGWRHAREVCEPYGGIEHETGRLRPEYDYTAPSSVYEVSQNGARLGVVTLDPEGYLYNCVRSCRETDLTSSPDHGRSALQAALDAYRAQGYEVSQTT